MVRCKARMSSSAGLGTAVVVLAILVAIAGTHAAHLDDKNHIGAQWESDSADVVHVETRTHFREWTTRFRKTYTTAEDFEYRLRVFAANKARIQTNNASSNASFTMELNQFGDMTAEEFSKTMKGLLVESTHEDVSASKVEPREYDISSAPKELDWRAKGAVTPVKNQGKCGSCWAFSATGALEAANFLATGSLTSLSEQELVSCSRREGNQGCHGGSVDKAFKWIEKMDGIASEENYPYVSGDAGAEPKCSMSAHYNVASVASFTDIEPSNPSALLAGVVQQPVSIGIEADAQSFQFYSSGVIKKGSCGTYVDHAVLLVGYGTENGTDYWLVKNSWSDSWGDEGYVKLERDMNTKDLGTCGLQKMPSFPKATKKMPPQPTKRCGGVFKKATCSNGTTCCCLEKSWLKTCKAWTCCADGDDDCTSQCS